ncbi:kinase-like domain-containing protein [Rhizophagus irregularis DAOM 181602=DAOM 197198]|nr:kinase-like domain-containing protein [Rhizophagus irregularis DAOM 181602=DAOM 197198]
MSINNDTKASLRSELNVLDFNHKNCSYCNQPFIEELWCKKCDPYNIIEGWTSENPDIDKFIKDSMYLRKYEIWLEWVPFDRFTNIERVGEGGFSKVYSATWIDGKASYKYEYGNWIKSDSKPIKVALKKLIGSHKMSIEYLNELKIHWNVHLEENFFLRFYGMTKDPVTNEFIMIIEFASEGSLRSILLSEFNKISWDDKIRILGHLILGLNNLHKLGYFHKNLHSRNVLVHYNYDKCYNTYISDFGLNGPGNKSKNQIYVMV